MIMSGRNETAGSDYRYGFNGMEKDDEVAGDGNSYTSYYRQYDPRVAKWKSIDPKNRAYTSPYSGFSNNPILLLDPQGDSTYMSKTGTGNKNVAIIHVTKDEWNGNNGVIDMHDWTGDLDNTEWDYIIVDDIRDAEKWLEENYQQGEIENMAVRLHSSGQVPENDNILTKKGIYHSTTDGQVQHISYKELNDGTSSSGDAMETSVISSMKNVFEFVSSTGTVVIGACAFAATTTTESGYIEDKRDVIDVDNALAIYNFVDIPNGNLYINTNTSGMWHALNGGGGEITKDGSFVNKAGWIRLNNIDPGITNSDIKITNSGFIEVQKIPASSSGQSGNCTNCNSGGNGKNSSNSNEDSSGGSSSSSSSEK